MKKRKMKADSVDQLFEIVKAVQQGQDPEEMLRKKQAESAPLADSPNSNPAENTGSSDRRAVSEDAEMRSANRKAVSEDAGVRSSDRRAVSEDAGVRSSDRRAVSEDAEMRNANRKAVSEDAEMRSVNRKAVSEDAEMRSVSRRAVSEEAGVRSDMRKIEPRNIQRTAKKQEPDWDDQDEFLALLNDESQNSFDVSAWKEKISDGIAVFSGVLKAGKQKNKKRGTEESKSVKSTRTKREGAGSEDTDIAPAERDVVESEAAENSHEDYDAAESKITKTTFAERNTVGSEEKSDIAKRKLQKVTLTESGTVDVRKTRPEYAVSEGIDSETAEKQEKTPETARKQEANPDTVKKQEEVPEIEKSEDERTIDRLLDLTKEQTQESEELQNRSSTEDAQKQETVLDQGIDLEEDAIRGRSDKEQEASIEKKISEQRENEPVEEQEEAEENAKQKIFQKKQGQNEKIQLSDIPKAVRQVVAGWKNTLLEKGFGKKEGILLLLVLVFVIIIVMLISNAIRISGENKKKREHVTADSGLTVLVEQEPEQWCRSGLVKLKVRAKGSKVLRAVLDGVSYEPDEDGMITVQAENYLLQLSVETEEKTLNAQVEIPKIDTQRPVVTAERTQEQIVLSAVDGRSGVGRIMYAVVKAGDYFTLPYYQEYTTPFAYEQGAIYYFYAEDSAGNRSVPVKTTMETAQEIMLTEETLCLFPNETRQLYVITKPEAALLNNITFESMNPSVAVVDGTGLITAVSEGATAVKVKADGLSEVMCAVEVSSSRTVTISTLGDCTLGTDAYFNTSVNFQAYESMYGSSYFFQDVKAILENDDATFANLEGVFTESTARENKQYAFKGDPDYTQILLDGSVEVVTLANNHSSDYGEQSKKDTKQYLTEAGIDYCDGDTIAMQELNGIKTAFIGIYVLRDGMAREEQVRTTIAEAKAQGAQLVIVAFHWGSEKATQPDETQTALAHIAVEEGADLVVGHHPHVLQGIEKYNGKYIVYSLANFCFGGNTNPSDTDTMIFRQTFTVTETGVQEDDQIEIIPCSVSGASGYNDYQPIPVTGTEADRIIGRINEYSAPYGQTYTAGTGLE